MADFLNCSEKKLNVTGGKLAFDMSNQGSDVAAGAIIPAAKSGNGGDTSSLSNFKAGKGRVYGAAVGDELSDTDDAKSGSGAELNFGQFSGKKAKTFGAPSVPNESPYGKKGDGSM